MKFLKIITLIFAILLSCSSEKSINDPKQDSIFGQWQLVEIESGFPTQIELIENGYLINFLIDFSYESNEFTICMNEVNQGIFSLSEIEKNGIIRQSVKITIDCDANSNNLLVREFYYTFEENRLILMPINPPCPESCFFKFSKVISE